MPAAAPGGQAQRAGQRVDAPLPAIGFGVIAGAGALFAWSKWYPALTVHGLQSIHGVQAGQAGTSAGAGAGVSTAHGFGTSSGLLGMAAVIALFAGIGLAAGMRRRRLTGSAVMLAAAIAMIATVTPTLLSAFKALSAWNNLPYRAGTGPGGVMVSIIASAATHAIDSHSIVPGVGVLAASVLALASGIGAVVSVLRARRRNAYRLTVRTAGTGSAAADSRPARSW